MTKLLLPERRSIAVVNPREEPTRYYYWPLVGWFYAKRLRMILDCIGHRRYDRLLEVAYGSGIFLPSLAQVAGELHGLECHRAEGVVQGNLAHHAIRAHLVPGSVEAIPYGDASFDCVVSVSLLEHLPDPGQALDEMRRVLRPGGCLAIGVPCRNPAMDSFFRLLGFDPRAIHPSSHRDVYEALCERARNVTVRRLPAWLPMDFGLYCVFVAEW